MQCGGAGPRREIEASKSVRVLVGISGGSDFDDVGRRGPRLEVVLRDMAHDEETGQDI